ASTRGLLPTTHTGSPASRGRFHRYGESSCDTQERQSANVATPPDPGEYLLGSREAPQSALRFGACVSTSMTDDSSVSTVAEDSPPLGRTPIIRICASSISSFMSLPPIASR